MQPWCYVNASDCTKVNLPSAYVVGAVGLQYSYETCDARDVFTEYYTVRDGLIRLCSVFSEHGSALDETAASGGAHARRRPCGNTRTHTQVEAMVRAMNALNGGLGWALNSGLVTRYYRLNYTWTTYPYKQWESAGRDMTRSLFSSGDCDVIVGMANGCSDTEIMDQATIANESRIIYMTGRGSQAVLTERGAEQPFLFSTHIRSDTYAEPALRHLYKLGARSAAVVYEEYGDYFLTDLGRYTVQFASEQAYDVRYNGTLRLLPDGSVDLPALDSLLRAVHATRVDVLVLVMGERELLHAIESLKHQRQAANDAFAGQPAHVYKAIWCVRACMWPLLCVRFSPRHAAHMHARAHCTMIAGMCPKACMCTRTRGDKGMRAHALRARCPRQVARYAMGEQGSQQLGRERAAVSFRALYGSISDEPGGSDDGTFRPNPRGNDILDSASAVHARCAVDARPIPRCGIHPVDHRAGGASCLPFPGGRPALITALGPAGLRAAAPIPQVW